MAPVHSRASKLLTISIPLPPSSSSFHPGSTLRLTISSNTSLPLGDVFLNVKITFKGTSGVQTGGALPSLHPLFLLTSAVDLGRVATNSTQFVLVFPEGIGCPCRPGGKESDELPPTMSFVNRGGVSREAEESGFMVMYSIEVVERRKGGLGKAERCGFW